MSRQPHSQAPWDHRRRQLATSSWALMAMVVAGCGDNIKPEELNTSPTVGEIENQTTLEDTPIVDLAFSIDDAESDLDTLEITAIAGDPAVIASVTLGGTGADRTLTIAPAADASGTSTITVSVSDGLESATTTFDVVVEPVNDPPTISAIDDQVVDENTSTGPLAFTIADIDTDVASLSVVATSSDQAVVADGDIALAGSDGNRTITVVPVAGASGVTTITVTVSDGGSEGDGVETFDVTVDAVNDPPVISAIADQTIAEDTGTGPIAFTVSDPDTPLGSLMITAVSSDQAVVLDADVVLGGSDGNRTISIDPVADASGNTDITITVSDGGSTDAVLSFAVEVTPVNDPPTITGIANQAINEDSSTAALPFSIDDIDTPLGSLMVTATSSDQGLIPDGNLVIAGSAPNLTITATPLSNTSGSASITVTVSDGGSEGDGVTVFAVSVGAVDDPPSISAIADQTIDEDTSTGAVGFTIADPDTPLGSLVVTATSNNQAVIADGALALGGAGANRTIVATPVADASGSAAITVTVSDGGAIDAMATFNITVNPVNDPPTVTAIADQIIAEDTDTGPLAFSIGDIDTPLGSLVVSAMSNDQMLLPDANLVLGGAGANRTITATPAPGASGAATVTVTVSDGGGQGDAVETFLVTVTADNDPPTVSAIADQTIDEDTSTGAIGFTIGDPDTPLGSLVVSATSSNQAVIADGALLLAGSGANRTITATPVPDANGSATITVTVSDGGATDAMTTFDVTVNPVNDPPTVSAIADQTINEDADTGVLNFVIGDIDTPIGSLVVTASSDDQALIPDANLALGGAGTNRTIVATPVADASGSATITITVSDGGGQGDGVETFAVTVAPVNDPPVITAIADQVINEDGATGALMFTISDVDDAVGTLVVSADSSVLSLVPVANIALGGAGANRTVQVTPVADGNGATVITVTVTDPGMASDSEPFTVTVNPINDPPSATDDSFLAGAGTTGNVQLAVAGSIMGNDTDVDGPSLTVTPFTGSTAQGGDLVLLADGTFTYTPAPGFLGNDTFMYTLNDNDPGMNLTATATVTIEVSLPMVWHVDNSVGPIGTGDGRNVSPFTRLKDVETAPVTGTGDTIMVAQGDGTSTGYNEGIVLKDNQLLLGDVAPGPPTLTNPGGDAITLANGNTVTSIQVVSPSGAGISANGVSGNATVTGLAIINAGVGVSLQASPTASFSFNGLEVSSSGTGFLASNAGTVSMSGGTVSASAAPAVDISSTTLSAATFTSVSSNNNNGRGISLVSNSGAVTFQSVSITNGADAGLHTRNAGTVNINAGTISTSNAPAVDAQDSTLGISLTNTSASNANQGIILINTLGSFAVVGDGTDARNGSGGSFTAMTFDGLLFINATNVSLSSITIQTTGNDGIYAQDVDGFALRGGSLINNGDDANDHGIEFANLSGAAVIDNTEIQSSRVDALRLINDSAFLTSLDITNSIFRDNSGAQGNVGLNLETRNDAQFQDVNISGCTFSGLQATGVLVTANNNSFIDVSASTSVFTNNNIAFDVGSGGSSSLVFAFTDNATITGHSSHAVNVFTASGSTGGSMVGTISGNTIGTAGVAASGSANGNGIRININGQTNGTIAVTGNDIRNVEFGRGIEALARLGTGGLDLTLDGNTIAEPGGFALAGMFVSSNDNNPMCANIVNNDVTGGPFFPGPFGGAYIVGEGDASPGVMRLQGFATDVATTLTNNGNMGSPISQLGSNIAAPASACATP